MVALEPKTLVEFSIFAQAPHWYSLQGQELVVAGSTATATAAARCTWVHYGEIEIGFKTVRKTKC